MANYIDFVVAASKDKALAKEFFEKLEKASAKELSDWFKSKGYTITEEDARKMIDNKNDIKKVGVTSY